MWLVLNLGIFSKLCSAVLIDSKSNALQLAWTGTVYLTPILGAWVADSKLGRFKTILLFSIIYVLGMVCLV
jgi:dipeptide/tripeptide permease